MVLIVSLAAGGWYFSTARGNEYTDAFCPELKNKKAYEEKKLSYYQMLIPGKGEWVFRTDNDFRKDWSIKPRTLKYLQRLNTAMKKHNAELVMVIPPIRGMVHIDRVFPEDQKEYGIDSPDVLWRGYNHMLDEIRQTGIEVVGATRDQMTPDFYYKRNHHWTSQGAEIVARNVAEQVRTLPAYKEIPEQEFVTVAKLPVVYESSFAKGFEELCGSTLPPEEPVEYHTQPKNTAQGDSALFGDEGNAAQIVLLGTSNSVLGSSYANFEGYLKEHLSRDVMNLSFVGAGIDTSLLAYLNSEHFTSDQPKIVIWEVPAYYELDIMDDKLFNQAIPAAYGGCADNPVLQRSFPDIPSDDRLVLFEQDGEENAGEDAGEENKSGSARFVDIVQDLNSKYLHLLFSEPIKEKFKVEFIYGDKGMKVQNFSRDKRYPHDGSFYTLFPKHGDNVLSEIVLSVSDDFTDEASLQASICSTDQ